MFVDVQVSVGVRTDKAARDSGQDWHGQAGRRSTYTSTLRINLGGGHRQTRPYDVWLRVVKNR